MQIFSTYALRQGLQFLVRSSSHTLKRICDTSNCVPALSGFLDLEGEDCNGSENVIWPGCRQMSIGETILQMEVVDQCKCVPPGNSRNRSSSYSDVSDTNERIEHALSGFANPARAIQLGLIDALRFLVEDKLINVNAKQWKTYLWCNDHVHLLTVTINANQPDAFDYLLSLEAIDFNGDSTEHDWDYYSNFIFSSALEGYVEDKHKCHFFQALVQHPKFQPNGRFLYGYNPNLQAPGKMSLLTMFVNEYTSMLMGYYREEVVKGKQKRFLHAFQLVLDAGADPRLEFDDLNSSFDIAVDNLGAASCGGISFGQRLVHTLEQMIKMMSNRGGK